MDLTIRQSMELALAHHGAGRLDQAEQMYRLILDADPNEPNALDMLGAVLSQRGRHAEGLALIDRALALRPDAADYHANRGLVLYGLSRTEEAIVAYRKSLSLRPGGPLQGIEEEIVDARIPVGHAGTMRAEINVRGF